ncbi:YciI family protein [Paraburkholderia ferrariae]|uniref:YciI family protein n=1 Tax=Paraburkholderia ferrariae TaxID=386056 RepID=UPI00048314BA|nr:YciI family protein [Paraburkholderia ferrariae]
MYVVSLTYQASLEAIDEALEAHRQFLDTHFAAGVFIAAGPKVPREGGVILAAGIERERLDAILATDPFAVKGLAGYTVTEFKATRIGAGVQLQTRAG